MAYSKKFGDRQFTFSRPGLDKVDRYLKAAQKGITKASGQLCADTITDEDRDAWTVLVQEKPGYAVQVANLMLEGEGFTGDDAGE